MTTSEPAPPRGRQLLLDRTIFSQSDIEEVLDYLLKLGAYPELPRDQAMESGRLIHLASPLHHTMWFALSIDGRWRVLTEHSRCPEWTLRDIQELLEPFDLAVEAYEQLLTQHAASLTPERHRAHEALLAQMKATVLLAAHPVWPISMVNAEVQRAMRKAHAHIESTLVRLNLSTSSRTARRTRVAA